MAKIVVVAGASAGVGRAVAEAFGRRGRKVALLARGADGLEWTRRTIEQGGGRALAIPTDVRDAEAVEGAAARAEAEPGPIGVWVNAVTITSFSPFAEMEADEFRRITEVVYLGTVHGTMAALRRMRPRGRGVVVQVGSALAHRALPLQSAYCGAKFAVRGFNEAVRVELRREGSGVRLSMVQLPAVNTPRFGWARNRMPRRPMPAPPVFRPEAAAAAVLRAADTAPRELWVGLPAARLILGAAVAPGLLDRLMARWGVEAQQAPEPEFRRSGRTTTRRRCPATTVPMAASARRRGSTPRSTVWGLYSWSYDVSGGLLVGPVLVALSIPVLRHVAAGAPELTLRLLVLALARQAGCRRSCATLQLYVVYSGGADSARYDAAGEQIAAALRAGLPWTAKGPFPGTAFVEGLHRLRLPVDRAVPDRRLPVLLVAGLLGLLLFQRAFFSRPARR